jgi:hypothetical protein
MVTNSHLVQYTAGKTNMSPLCFNNMFSLKTQFYQIAIVTFKKLCKNDCVLKKN